MLTRPSITAEESVMALPAAVIPGSAALLAGCSRVLKQILSIFSDTVRIWCPHFKRLDCFGPVAVSHAAFGPEKVISAAVEELSLDIRFQLRRGETSPSCCSVCERKPSGKTATIYDSGEEKRCLRG